MSDINQRHYNYMVCALTTTTGRKNLSFVMANKIELIEQFILH